MTSHRFHKISVLICCCAFCISCGKASPEKTQKNHDSASDAAAEIDTSRSTDSSVKNSETSTEQPTPLDTTTIPEDTFATDPNCIHPEVIESCSNGWCTIPPGCFTAGSPIDELWHGAGSEIQNQVTLTHAFEIQQFEVTQEQWKAAGLYNPSSFGPNGDGQCSSNDCPLENINWYEAVAFANRMSELRDPPLPECYTLNNCTGDIGKGMVCETVTVNSSTIYECAGYRLPTMYESEYAFRAGTRTAFYSGDMTDTEMTTECTLDVNLDRIAWYCRNSDDRTHPVGLREPNGWGLHDMAGNVFEWVDTQFNGQSTGPDPVTDPIGPTDVPDRHVMRGGVYFASAPTCRAARNFEMPPEQVILTPGTRLARTL